MISTKPPVKSPGKLAVKVLVTNILSIRLVGKLDATLTCIAGSKLETCNKVCITQGPASRGTKNEFIIGEIIEVLNVGDLTAKHPYYNNCRLHHYALDKSSSDNPLLKLENTVNRINSSPAENTLDFNKINSID